METDACGHPLLAVDAIVRVGDQIVLVRRRNPPEGWAIPGGFVEHGETVERAVRREIREETGLELDDLTQWRVFSDPDRDPRRHVVSLCFTARSEGSPRSGSDARDVGLFRPSDPPAPLAFDHEHILRCYRRERGG